ncbi:MAG TPA: sigma-70 family RNA polymerase sigma factor [Candidatus Limnocylindria bacterium]
MDRETVIRAQAGDQEAFARLARALTPSFLSTAHRILRDIGLAEDATQRAMLSIWKGLPRLREPDRFQAWSYRLLVRACYTEGRRSRKWAPAIGQFGPDDSRTPDPTGAVIDRDELERAFRRLSLNHRAVVVLRYYRQMSMDEIADALAISVGTAASRLHYAMRALRSAVEADARPAEGRALP